MNQQTVKPIGIESTTITEVRAADIRTDSQLL